MGIFSACTHARLGIVGHGVSKYLSVLAIVPAKIKLNDMFGVNVEVNDICIVHSA